MDGPHAGLQAPEAAADVHEAGVVPCGADFGLGVENALSLSPNIAAEVSAFFTANVPPNP